LSGWVTVVKDGTIDPCLTKSLTIQQIRYWRLAPCILDRRQRGLDDFKQWSLNASAKNWYAKKGTLWRRENPWDVPVIGYMEVNKKNK